MLRLLLLLLSALACANAVAAPAIGETCHLSGHSEPLRCVTIDVPLDPARADAGTLPLHVTIAAAVREAAVADPLFVLAGGPGQAGSDIVFLLDVAFARVRTTRDIVLIDQRGTGRSGRLACGDVAELDLADEATIEARMRDCLAALDASLQHYSTANAAHDIDRVRAALGYDAINVWGGSYGTRLAQTYARLYPQRVRALILDSVAAPEQIIGLLGNDPQQALEALFQRCERESACAARYPWLRQAFAELDARLREQTIEAAIRHPRSAEPQRLKVSHARFVEAVRVSLYQPQFAARLPYLLDEASRNNWQPFASLLATQADFAGESMAMGMTLAVLCAEDLAHLTTAEIDAEAKASFLGGRFLDGLKRYCPQLPVTARARPDTTTIAAPALLLSGALDPVTPPSRADAAAAHMPLAQHVVVAHAGHGVSHLGCAPRLLRQFLDAPEQRLDASCLERLSLPPLMLGAAGPRP